MEIIAAKLYRLCQVFHVLFCTNWVFRHRSSSPSRSRDYLALQHGIKGKVDIVKSGKAGTGNVTHMVVGYKKSLFPAHKDIRVCLKVEGSSKTP